MNDPAGLSIDLVPERAWRRNVRAVVSGGTWDALRWGLGASLYRPRFISIDFPDRRFRPALECAYCRTEHNSPHLHEEWQYDDNARVQRLMGLLQMRGGTFAFSVLAVEVDGRWRIGSIPRSIIAGTTVPVSVTPRSGSYAVAIAHLHAC